MFLFFECVCGENKVRRAMEQWQNPDNSGRAVEMSYMTRTDF